MVAHFKAFVIALLLSTPALAEVTTISIQPNGVSNIEGKLTGDANSSINTIYGGLSGDECTVKNGTTYCDNCPTTTTNSCNSKRIYDGLYFYVEIKTTLAGNIFVTNDSDDSQVELDYIISGGVFTGGNHYYIQANQTITVGVPWSQACGTLFSGTNCTTFPADASETSKIRIGVDSGDTEGATGDNKLTSGEYTTDLQITIIKGSGTAQGQCTSDAAPVTPNGVCNFIAYPGDEKVFIEEVMAGCSLSATTNAIRIYYTDVSSETSNTTHPDLKALYKDLKVGDTTATCSESKQIALLDNEITGLAIGNTYRFSAAILDKANNVDLLYQPAAVAEGDSTNCFNSTNSFNCHYAVPEKVIGLLDDEFDCFITTATYGSPFKPKVQTFRKFRNLYLKTNSLGRWIINSYYKHSPPLASWIRSNPWSKKYVRMALYPLWAFASLSLHSPFWLMAATLLGLAFVFRKKLLGRIKQ